MNSIGELLLPIIFFLLIVATGFLLHRSIDAYYSLLFTFHKLAALVFIIFTYKLISSGVKMNPAGHGMVLFLVTGTTAVSSLFATGIIMSVKKSYPLILPFIHILGTLLLLFCIIAVLSILLRK